MATAEEEAKFLEKEEALLAKKKLKTETATQSGAKDNMEEEKEPEIVKTGMNQENQGVYLFRV